ncbi:uncharacterized protein LOC109845997 [Asparagus officinalis]|uniref:uncharacterized protein LOC109845997 n=1 Tax=Asparagus officinalis TaxID=4686 RepID=UPI00098DE8FA|nr:uncharacterized protein LOC109845997 [Asparagus officinalis]
MASSFDYEGQILTLNLEMSHNTPTTGATSIAPTPTDVDHDSSGGDSAPRAPKRLRSNVWNFFEKIEVTRDQHSRLLTQKAKCGLAWRRVEEIDDDELRVEEIEDDELRVEDRRRDAREDAITGRGGVESQVAIFVVLAMTLRRKPDILVSILPKVRDNPKYQGHEKFPVHVWVVGQASQGDLVAGMYAWVHYVLPLISGKPNVNPQSRDFALQLVERFLSGPKARSILLNGAVRKGERLVPPSALDLLMRATFPAQSARVKATERFEAIYPTLKEVALAGSPGTKTTKQASQQLLPLTVEAMQENNPVLTREAADVFVWCLVQNPDCYKQWEKLHLENIGASIAVLRKLSNEWKEYSAKFSPPDALRQTIKSLRVENEKALSVAVDASNQASLKEADKHCKVISGRISRGSGCLKSGLFVLMVAVAIGFAASPNMESWDLKKLQSMITSSLQSF